MSKIFRCKKCKVEVECSDKVIFRKCEGCGKPMKEVKNE